MGIHSSFFRHCKFDENFHDSVISHIEKTLFENFLNLKRGTDLGRSWLVFQSFPCFFSAIKLHLAKEQLWP